MHGADQTESQAGNRWRHFKSLSFLTVFQRAGSDARPGVVSDVRQFADRVQEASALSTHFLRRQTKHGPWKIEIGPHPGDPIG